MIGLILYESLLMRFNFLDKKMFLFLLKSLILKFVNFNKVCSFRHLVCIDQVENGNIFEKISTFWQKFQNSRKPRIPGYRVLGSAGRQRSGSVLQRSQFHQNSWRHFCSYRSLDKLFTKHFPWVKMEVKNFSRGFIWTAIRPRIFLKVTIPRIFSQSVRNFENLCLSTLSKTRVIFNLHGVGRDSLV